ncbi:uncharacterized protein EHS24_005653 [Apiotrichum porosum]|uniref:Uncharacterized protein n=1 Tax=Apiotrichum porosum TaxID=105984 RepID=A0A427XZ84_9TREE|nr:uncharacterized protein EHS24_005653 [Apiotrichum porosum]RSH84150.1 hypothetical protein EHS24_005653 [Apiotrichum porosum]
MGAPLLVEGDAPKSLFNTAKLLPIIWRQFLGQQVGDFLVGDATIEALHSLGFKGDQPVVEWLDTMDLHDDTSHGGWVSVCKGLVTPFPVRFKNVEGTDDLAFAGAIFTYRPAAAPRVAHPPCGVSS